jgi:chromosome segregation ATPase
MRLFVVVCSTLLMIAAAFQVVSADQQPAALLDRALSLPLPQQIAWGVIFVAALALIAGALWLAEKLVQERRTSDKLEAHIHGVADAVEELDGSQKDADSAVGYLARTDPQQAIRNLQQRLTKTEQAVDQHGQREGSDLLTRLEELRNQQKELRETLAAAIGRRRSIEQQFTELQRSQEEIERMLAGIEGGTGELQDRIQKLAQSIDGTNPRFDEIERLMETLVQLKRGFGVLQARLAPLEHNEHGGVNNLTRAVHDLRDQLVARVDLLDREGGVTLAERVSLFAETKDKLELSISGLLDEFSRLDLIRKDMSGLFDRLSKVIDANGLAHEAQGHRSAG